MYIFALCVHVSVSIYACVHIYNIYFHVYVYPHMCFYVDVYKLYRHRDMKVLIYRDMIYIYNILNYIHDSFVPLIYHKSRPNKETLLDIFFHLSLMSACITSAAVKRSEIINGRLKWDSITSFAFIY